MEEIQIAYPILDQSTNKSIINIKYDVDYDFVIKYKIDEYIEITLKYSYIVYQQLITKSDLPLDRLFKLIINSLNKEPNYLIDIKLDNDIILGINYNSDMIDINQQITLVKQSDTKTTELLLVNKVKELEKRIIEIEQRQNLPYGYNIDATTLTINIEETLSKIYYTYKLDNLYIEPTLFQNIEIQKLFKKINTIIFNIDFMPQSTNSDFHKDYKNIIDIFNSILNNCNVEYYLIYKCDNRHIKLEDILKYYPIKCKSITINTDKTLEHDKTIYYTENNIPIYYKN